MSHAALTLAASLKSDRGPRLGELWTAWQHDDARAILAPEDGEPRRHWLARPKGGSKDTDVAALVLAWLIEDAGPLDEAYVIGADEDQGNRLLNRARGFVQRSRLGTVAKVEAAAIVNPKNGARVNALAADVSGGEGLLSPLIVVEELPNWADTPSAKGMWTVAFSSIPKWPGMTFVVIGHAGAPEHWSFKLHEHARTDALWRYAHVDGPLPWVSEADLDEQRRLLLPSQFARRHLNQWVAGEDTLATRDDVVACVGHVGDLAPEWGRQYVVALDIGLVNDRTVAVVAHAERRPAGLTVVADRVAVWKGRRDAPVDLSVVEAWVETACREYGASLVFDPFQAAHVTQRLKARGVSVREFTFTQASVGRLAATMFNLLRARCLDLPDNAELIEELCAVKLRETGPGVVRMDHSSSGHDDMAITVAMAAAELVARGEGGPTTSNADELAGAWVGDPPVRTPGAWVATGPHELPSGSVQERIGGRR